jgi:hypothetical protein
MYLCHFTVFRTADVTAAGGFRSDFDGAQDFDLALRLMGDWDRETVLHIPLPLYHWRSWSGSTAQSAAAKPWAQQATARAQEAHLERLGLKGSVAPSAVQGLNEVHPRPSFTASDVCVIIPTAGTSASTGDRFVDRAVATIRQARGGGDLQIVAITTGDVLPIDGVDCHVPASPGSFNFSRVINEGRKHTGRPVLLLLNDDTELSLPESIDRMLEVVSLPGVGVVGARLEYPDGRIQHAGLVNLPGGPTHVFIGKPASYPGYFGSALTPRNYSAVTAAAMVVRTDVFDAVGGFDEEFARDFNDVDFCLRVWQQGSRVAWTPYARFIHHEGASLERREPDRAEADLFSQRWATACPDPFYSPALHQTLGRLYQPR